MNYTKIPTDRRNLERIIVTYPHKIKKSISNIEECDPENNKTYYIKDGKTIDRINENSFVFNYINLSPILKKIGIGWMLFSIFVMVVLLHQFSIVFFWIGIVPSIIFLILAYTIPKHKYLIFHRHNGILELPGAYYDKPHHVPFSEVPAFFGPNGGAGLFFWSLKVKRSFKFSIKDFFPIDLDFFMTPGWETWSYWVWYMDKNRPLPPGEALDEFRQQDFERRKAEGFPPPIYKSRFPTPELTIEQQIEREQYWKDEDFMVP